MENDILSIKQACPTTVKLTNNFLLYFMLFYGKDFQSINYYISFKNYLLGNHMIFKNCE